MKLPRNIIAAVGILVSLVVAGVAFRWYFEMVPAASHSADLDWYVRKAEQWEFLARLLRIVQVLLAAGAIVSSVLAASEWKPAVPRGLLAVVAAISIALMTGLDLTGIANRTRNAERRLTFAILEFRQTSGGSLDPLLKAYQEAEALIGDYSPQVAGK